MYTCAHCQIMGCRSNSNDNLPQNCPMLLHPEIQDEPDPAYFEPEHHDFYVKSSEIEATGYGEWPRIREIIELCHDCGYKKVGLAFCAGLKKEAQIAANILMKNGLEVVSVICKVGHVEKKKVGITKTIRKPCEFEPICNPVQQAKLLDAEKPDLNIVFGLCVGHDTLFYKYTKTLVTTLVVKDRVLAHNPIGAIYCADGYMKKRLDSQTNHKSV